MGERLPWFPLYVYDFQSDEHVIPMTYEEEGLYLALLRHEWIHGSIPNDSDEIRRIVKPHSSDALEAVKRCFTVTTDGERLYSKKLERVRRDQEKARQQHVRAGRQGGMRTALSKRSGAQATLRSFRSTAQATEQSRAEQNRTEEQPQPSDAPASATKGKWLAPYFVAWTEAYHGDPSPKELARYIAPLRAKHGDEAVTAAWLNYLHQTEAQFASPARFSKTYGTWAGTAPGVAKLTAKQREEQASLEWVEQRERKASDGD